MQTISALAASLYKYQSKLVSYADEGVETFRQWLMDEPIKTSHAVVGYVSGLGRAPQVPEGQPIPKDGLRKGHETLVPVTKTAIYVELGKEHEYADPNKLADALLKETKQSITRARERMAYNVVANNATTVTGPDGVVFRSASHPAAGETYSNTGSAVALNTTSLQQAVTQVNSTRLRGEPVTVSGGFTLIVGMSLWHTANVLLSSSNFAAASGAAGFLGTPAFQINDKNVLQQHVMNLIVTPYVDSATGWLLVPKNKDEHALRRITRMPLTVMQSESTQNMSIQVAVGEEFAVTYSHVIGTYSNAGA